MSKWVVGGLAVGVAAAVGAYYLNSSSSNDNETVSNKDEEPKQTKTKKPVEEPEEDNDEDVDVPIDKLTPEQKEMLLKDRYGFLAEISEWMKKDPASGSEAQLIKFLNKNVHRLDDGFIWMAERLALVDFADEQAEILIGALTLLAQLVALLGARINFRENEKYRVGVIEACVNTVRNHLKNKGHIQRYIDLTKFLITVYTQDVSRYTGYEEEFQSTSNKILACWESIAAVVSEHDKPEEYASVQLNLAVVYSMLGNDVDLESQKYLHNSITCCNNALKYFDEEKHKEQYGQLHKVLGTAYWALHNVIRTEQRGESTQQQMDEDMWKSAPDYQSDEEEELAKMLQAHLGLPDDDEEEEQEHENRVQEIDSDEEKAINEENERKHKGLTEDNTNTENIENTDNNTEQLANNDNNGTDNKVVDASKAPQPMSPEESVYVEKAIESLEKAYNCFETSKPTAAITIMKMQIHSHLTELYSCRDQGDAEDNRNKARLHSDKALEIIGKMRRE